MTDQIEDQDVELEEEIQEAQDPKATSEPASLQSVDAASDAVKGKAKSRKGDKANSEPMQKIKTKAGMINAAYDKMSRMKKEDLRVALSKLMGEDVDLSILDDDVIAESPEVSYDYNGELDALVESEATLSEDFKAKTAIIFETALKSKLSEEIDRLEEAYKEELDSEIDATKNDLVEKVDSYLNYVVENWMEDNKVAIETGLRTEIAEGFMSKMKDLFSESYIEVPESKIDLVDELATANEELEEQFNTAMKKSLDLAEELETLKRDAIIREASKDLAETQVEKLKDLAEKVDFEDADTFAKKVATIKESYFAKKTTAAIDLGTPEDDNEVDTEVVSDSMTAYVNALKKTIK
jgi:hypothetical protein